jgi:hypothetical protein
MVKAQKSVLEVLYKNKIISLSHFRAAKKLRSMYFVFLKRIEAPKGLGSSLRPPSLQQKDRGSPLIPEDSVCHENLWKYLYRIFQQQVQETNLLRQGMQTLLWDEPIQKEQEKNLIDCIKTILEETRKGIKKYDHLYLKKTRTPGVFIFC